MATRKKEKFAQILQAAERVFAQHGFHGSQVSRVAQEAGVAGGTIYLYFKSKEDILISLFKERLGELVERIDRAVSAAGSAAEALRKLCEIHLTLLEQNVDLALVTQIELRQNSLEMRREIGKALKPYLDRIAGILQKGVENKEFRPDLDIKLARQLVFGGLDEAVSTWLISGRKYSLSGQTDKIVDFYLRALKA